jgi:hypothetical protein
VKDMCAKMDSREPTSLQLSCWKRLWGILLAPPSTTSPGTGEQTTAAPEDANAASADRAESGVNG